MNERNSAQVAPLIFHLGNNFATLRNDFLFEGLVTQGVHASATFGMIAHSARKQHHGPTRIGDRPVVHSTNIKCLSSDFKPHVAV